MATLPLNPARPTTPPATRDGSLPVDPQGRVGQLEQQLRDLMLKRQTVTPDTPEWFMLDKQQAALSDTLAAFFTPTFAPSAAQVAEATARISQQYPRTPPEQVAYIAASLPPDEYNPALATPQPPNLLAAQAAQPLGQGVIDLRQPQPAPEPFYTALNPAPTNATGYSPATSAGSGSSPYANLLAPTGGASMPAYNPAVNPYTAAMGTRRAFDGNVMLPTGTNPGQPWGSAVGGMPSGGGAAVAPPPQRTSSTLNNGGANAGNGMGGQSAVAGWDPAKPGRVAGGPQGLQVQPTPARTGSLPTTPPPAPPIASTAAPAYNPVPGAGASPWGPYPATPATTTTAAGTAGTATANPYGGLFGDVQAQQDAAATANQQRYDALIGTNQQAGLNQLSDINASTQGQLAANQAGNAQYQQATQAGLAPVLNSINTGGAAAQTAAANYAQNAIDPYQQALAGILGQMGTGYGAAVNRADANTAGQQGLARDQLAQTLAAIQGGAGEQLGAINGSIAGLGNIYQQGQTAAGGQIGATESSLTAAANRGTQQATGAINANSQAVMGALNQGAAGRAGGPECDTGGATGLPGRAGVGGAGGHCRRRIGGDRGHWGGGERHAGLHRADAGHEPGAARRRAGPGAGADPRGHGGHAERPGRRLPGALNTLNTGTQAQRDLLGQYQDTASEREQQLRQQEEGDLQQRMIDSGLATTTAPEAYRAQIADDSALRQREIQNAALDRQLGVEDTATSRALGLGDTYAGRQLGVSQSALGQQLGALSDYGSASNAAIQNAGAADASTRQSAGTARAAAVSDAASQRLNLGGQITSGGAANLSAYQSALNDLGQRYGLAGADALTHAGDQTVSALDAGTARLLGIGSDAGSARLANVRDTTQGLAATGQWGAGQTQNVLGQRTSDVQNALNTGQSREFNAVQGGNQQALDLAVAGLGATTNAALGGNENALSARNQWNQAGFGALTGANSAATGALGDAYSLGLANLGKSQTTEQNTLSNYAGQRGATG